MTLMKSSLIAAFVCANAAGNDSIAPNVSKDRRLLQHTPLPHGDDRLPKQ
jgi:hypothetical protein